MSLLKADLSTFVRSCTNVAFDQFRMDRREPMSEQERQEIIQDADAEYPLVALKNIVVFPHNRHALTIGREKMVRAIEEAMMRPDRTLITATQRNAAIDDPESKDIYPSATLVDISTMHRQADGSLQVLVRG